MNLYGVGEKNSPPRWKLQLLQLRVQRRKHPRRLQNSSLSQSIEQCALPCIRVAYQSHYRHRHCFPALPLLATDTPDGLQLLLHMMDSKPDLAAIRLQLGFAWSASTDTAAKLAHRLTPAGQPRKLVFQLRQLHLQLSFRVSGRARQRCPGSAGSDRSHVSPASIQGCASAKGVRS